MQADSEQGKSLFAKFLFKWHLLNERAIARTNERTNTGKNEWTIERMNAGASERKNERMNERRIDATIERMNAGANARRSKWTNVCIHEQASWLTSWLNNQLTDHHSL